MGWEIDDVTLEQREAVQPPPPLGEAAAAAGLIDDLQSPGSKKRHLLICKLFFPQVPSLKPNGVGIVAVGSGAFVALGLSCYLGVL
jgi:hypothetical protein